jgi:hypothetical protein
MSKENVTGFFKFLKKGDGAKLLNNPVPAEIIRYAKERGFEFSEGELKSVMKELIFTAQSLPDDWGWNLARTLDLVRKT